MIAYYVNMHRARNMEIMKTWLLPFRSLESNEWNTEAEKILESVRNANGSVYSVHWEHGTSIRMTGMEGKGQVRRDFVFMAREGAYEIFAAYILI